MHLGQGLRFSPYISSGWLSRDKFVRYTITIVINIKMTLLVYRLHIHLPLFMLRKFGKKFGTHENPSFSFFFKIITLVGFFFFCGRFFDQIQERYTNSLWQHQPSYVTKTFASCPILHWLWIASTAHNQKKCEIRCES